MAGKIAATKKMPKQARAKARVEAILAATEKLLIAEGPDNITTTAIARDAGIPVGSVYQYFSDRDDILTQLYGVAYDAVIKVVADKLESLPGDGSLSFEVVNHTLLETFWAAARAHPTFRPLTRWANHSHSLWEVTPGLDSHIDELIAGSLMKSGVSLDVVSPPAVMRTLTMTISILVDQAIEEDDEQLAEQLIEELARMISSYLS